MITLTRHEEVESTTGVCNVWFTVDAYRETFTTDDEEKARAVYAAALRHVKHGRSEDVAVSAARREFGIAFQRDSLYVPFTIDGSESHRAEEAR